MVCWRSPPRCLFATHDPGATWLISLIDGVALGRCFLLLNRLSRLLLVLINFPVGNADPANAAASANLSADRSRNRFGLSLNPRRSRQGWIYGGLLAGTVGVATIAIASYQAVRGLILDNLKRQAVLEVAYETEKLDHWLSNRKTEVSVLAHTPLVQTMDWAKMQNYLVSEVSRQRNFHQLTLVRPTGAYATTKVGEAKANLRDRQWFQAVMAGQTLVTDPVISRTTGRTQINVVTPIPNLQTGRIVGGLSGAIEIQRFQEILQRLNYGEESYAFALNAQGSAIAHPNPDVISTQEAPTASFLQSPNAELAAIARKMLQKQQGIELIQLEGRWVYIAYVPLQEASWSIALVIPKKNIESALRPLNVLAGLLSGFLVLAVLGVWRQGYTYEKMRFQARQEALLNQLTAQIRSSLDLSTIVQTTVVELAALLKLPRVLFVWHAVASTTVELEADSQGDGPMPRSLRLPTAATADLDAWLHHQRPLQLTAIAPPELELELQADRYLAFAIPAAEDKMGYLLAQHNQRLDNADQELLNAVANQLAIAITQAHLYQQTQDQVQLLNETVTKLNQAQLQLVQTEKMSSLGQLVAGIAHEINNPVNFIHGNLDYGNEYAKDLVELVALYRQHYPNPVGPIQTKIDEMDVDFLIEDFNKLMTSMQLGTSRIREIVQSLRVFARLDEAEVKTVDLHQGIDSTLMILQSRLNATPDQQAIQVQKQYGDLPLVECYAGQLNQVFMNVINNAIDALEVAGRRRLDSPIAPTITIRTMAIATHHPPLPNAITDPHLTPPVLHAMILIQDNGAGIPEAIQSRIFDPFFTTKPVGQGTGMGLAISYQVVTERHRGRLYCLSNPDRGTKFVIAIPIARSPDAPVAPEPLAAVH